MNKSIELKEHFPVSPDLLYEAWLDSQEHSNMTGGEAICNADIEGKFSAWDGYISGINKSLTKGKEIVQLWRTSEFKEEDDYSELTIRFKPTTEGCELTLIHDKIPAGEADYKTGWVEHYFTPMKEYFK